MYQRKMKTLESLEKQFATLCEDIYALNMKGKIIRTLPPKIVIRVLPKEHKTESGLYVPGSVQNKPMYEAIVLSIWEPYWEHRRKKNSEGKYEYYGVYHECEVQVGDRIMFPHFEGVPMESYLDEKYYRTIRSDVVFGTLNYQGDIAKVAEIKKIMEKFGSITLSGAKSGPGVPDWQPPSKASFFTS